VRVRAFKSKIEDAGYLNVGDLKKDDNGVWSGKASKGGFVHQRQ
jgi:hypothetical protein